MDCRHISSPVADRVAVQADKAGLPPEILLRGKRKCNQNPDMGHTFRFKFMTISAVYQKFRTFV